MQARISILERKLAAFDKEVSRSENMIVKDAARTWAVLVEQSGNGAPWAKNQTELIDEMQAALKTYREVSSTLSQSC
jgi:hypothetical protein